MPAYGIEWIPFTIAISMGLIALAVTIFWIVALVDCLRREFRGPNEKIMWVLVIIFTHGVGALIYWIMGKSQGTLPGETETASPPPTE